MPLSQSDILGILAAGDFSPLIGEFETEELECKRQPYGLDSDEQKLELAKDISGLANAKGGLLLIGFATKKSPTHGQDEIHCPRPFPLDRFNADQYRQVIQSWLWPPAERVDVIIFPSSIDNLRGVASIVVPQVSEENRPQLVAKTMLDSSRKIEIIFGYCNRNHSQVAHYDVARLHALLRDGIHFDSRMRLGFEALQIMIEGIGVTALSAPVPPENVEVRIEDAIRAAGFNEKPVFALISVPKRKLDLRQLFEARDTPLVDILEDPPTIRSGGFNLNVGHHSRIVEGRLRRVVFEGYGLLEFHRDGVAIYVAPGDGGRLCWGRAERQVDSYLINQMALVEMTYLFCKALRLLYEGRLQSGECFDLQMKILRLGKGVKNFLLEPGPLDGFGGPSIEQAPSVSRTFHTEVRYDLDSPERAAVLILSELYNWVGYEESSVPYTAVVDGRRVIEPEQILRAGG